VINAFGARLRRERERRRISLDSIAASTNIRASLFDQLERGDASKWPSGIFRRSFMRAYAAAIGLDPETTVREFLEAFPDPAQPAPPQSLRPKAAPSLAPAELRLQLADEGAGAQRWLAIAIDTGAAAALGAAGWLSTGELWMPLTVLMFAYYFVGTILTGATPGVFVLAWSRRRKHAPAAPVAATVSAAPFLVHPERGHTLSLELSTQSSAASQR
jgi:transcriptional regulator with XRE-family HTH domain